MTSDGWERPPGSVPPTDSAIGCVGCVTVIIGLLAFWAFILWLVAR